MENKEEVEVGLRVTLSSSKDLSSTKMEALMKSELRESSFLSTRRTKIVGTMTPTTCRFDDLEALVVGEMNVARINVCHDTREWT